MTNNPITGTTCRSRLRAKPEEASFHLGPVSLVPAANIHKACGRHKDFQSQSKVQVLDGRAERPPIKYYYRYGSCPLCSCQAKWES